jgi:hypothetical protein
MTRLFADISSNMWKQDKLWYCQKCSYSSNHKGHVFEHVEAKHIEHHPGYECSYCGLLMYNKSRLRKHKCPRKPKDAESNWIGLQSYRDTLASMQ